MSRPSPSPEVARIRADIERIARQELRRDGPLPDGDLGEHLDSVERLTLIVGIEDHFEICFEPEDEADVRTVDDVVALVQARLAARDGAL